MPFMRNLTQVNDVTVHAPAGRKVGRSSCCFLVHFAVKNMFFLDKFQHFHGELNPFSSQPKVDKKAA